MHKRVPSDPEMRAPDFRRFWFGSILAQFGAQVTLLAPRARLAPAWRAAWLAGGLGEGFGVRASLAAGGVFGTRLRAAEA